MKDIKVLDSLKELASNEAYVIAAYYSNPLLFLAEAVSLTRKEPGVSIEDIGKCFRMQFDEAELSALIHELNKPKM